MDAEDPVDLLYAYEAGRDKLLSLTNRALVVPAAGCALVSSADSVHGAEAVCQKSHTVPFSLGLRRFVKNRIPSPFPNLR